MELHMHCTITQKAWVLPYLQHACACMIACLVALQPLLVGLIAVQQQELDAHAICDGGLIILVPALQYKVPKSPGYQRVVFIIEAISH